MLSNHEEIRNALDIADIIGERVKLRPASRGYSGLCPFHDEHTPSFHVYTDTQSYYCFGCHETGDIFTFLMKTENLSFPEALQRLADRAGMTLPERKTGERTAYDVLDLTAKFYTDSLKSRAMDYIERLKLDNSDISRFSLGYSPNLWDALVKYLRHIGIADKQMLELGLAQEGKHGLYDKFRGRIMFPIRDMAGRIIAFGGRLIDGEGAKYVNSPDSAIYKNLYLLDKAKNTIREKKRSILVEGYMDAIRLHKSGFTEAVATLGTSLTPEQAETLSRFAGRCYICYDSDKAVRKATLRRMFVLQEHGLDVYVVNLSSSKDPDEFLIEHTPKDFEDALSKARPLIVQYIEAFKTSLADSLTRKSAMKELFMTLSELAVHEVLEYKVYLSEATGVPPSKLEEWFVSKQKRQLPESTFAHVDVKGIEHPCEAALCSLLFHHAEYKINMDLAETAKLLITPTAREVALALLCENPEELFTLWTSLGETEKIAFLERGDEILRPDGRTEYSREISEHILNVAREIHSYAS